MSAIEIATPADVKRIRELNDAFRTTFVGGLVHVTCGVHGLAPEVKAEVLRRVRAFNRFGPRNDPHHEHDFSSFEIGTQVFMWKIDYYDKACQAGSENPADPAVTTRVLTVCLAEEY